MIENRHLMRRVQTYLKDHQATEEVSILANNKQNSFFGQDMAAFLVSILYTVAKTF
jgi:hypothetical protein